MNNKKNRGHHKKNKFGAGYTSRKGRKYTIVNCRNNKEKLIGAVQRKKGEGPLRSARMRAKTGRVGCVGNTSA